MIQNVYTDTSVIGGCFDDEFSEHSLMLFSMFINRKKFAVISDLTLQELVHAPTQVKD